MADSLPIVPISEEWRLEGDLSFDDATKHLMERLNQVLDNEALSLLETVATFGLIKRNRYKYEKIAQLMLAQIDPQYWSKFTLDNVDILPLVSRIGSIDTGTVRVGDNEVEVSDGTLNLANIALDKVTVATSKDLVAQGFSMDSEVPSIIQSRIDLDYVPDAPGTLAWGRLSSEPVAPTAVEYQMDSDVVSGEIDDLAGQVAAGQTVFEGEFSPDLDGDSATVWSPEMMGGLPTPLLTRQQFNDYVAQDPANALGILVDQSNTFDAQQEYRSTARELGATQDQLNEELGPLVNYQPRVRYGGRGLDIGGYTGPQDKGMSHNEILAMPSTMTREQVVRMSERLEAAGYFEGTGRPGVVGDFSDRNFQEAWRKLVNAAVASGKPMLELLNEQEAAKKEEEDILAKVKASLTDSARIRINADAMAKSMIGRKLSAKEQQSLVQHIHDLEREHARESYELGESDEAGEIEELDWTARMEEEIRARNPGEAGAKDIANTYDDFTGLLSGPGPGVGRST